MNIIVNDTHIMLQTDDAAASHILLTKPDIADYSNVTTRPLVKSYHLIKETIWDRFCQCVQDTAKHCTDDVHRDCYAMAFSALYPALLSNSQTKNVLYYGQESAAFFLSFLEDFMTFLQPDSSLVALSPRPFVCSGLANGSFHAAVIDLDAGCDLPTICDVLTKIRKNGTVVLYTALDTPAGDVARLLSHAAKTVFSSSTLYVLTMNPALGDLIYPYSSEALVLTYTEELLPQITELKSLIQNILQGDCQPEDCLYAAKLLTQTENILWGIYDYLENYQLPVYTNLLKEAVMDCSIGLSAADNAVYFQKLSLAAQDFFSAIETEF